MFLHQTRKNAVLIKYPYQWAGFVKHVLPTECYSQHSYLNQIVESHLKVTLSKERFLKDEVMQSL